MFANVQILLSMIKQGVQLGKCLITKQCFFRVWLPDITEFMFGQCFTCRQVTDVDYKVYNIAHNIFRNVSTMYISWSIVRSQYSRSKHITMHLKDDSRNNFPLMQWSVNSLISHCCIMNICYFIVTTFKQLGFKLKYFRNQSCFITITLLHKHSGLALSILYSKDKYCF